MKILFIGNSYQYASNVSDEFSSDGQFLAIAKAAGHTITSNGCYIGNSILSQHWNDSDWNNPRDQLETGNYDLVILNGGGSSSDVDVGGKFADLAKANGTEVMVFDPWAADNAMSISGGDGYGFVHKQALAIATQNGAAYAPVASAYEKAYHAFYDYYGVKDDGRTVEQNFTYDGVHPTKLAGYLAGLVLYGTTFGEKPPSPSVYRPAGVSLEEATMLYTAAWAAVQESAILLDDTGTGGGGGGGVIVGDNTITGRAFVDADKDGIDEADKGMSGVSVTLWKVGTGVVATTTTAADGSYSFGSVADGTYQVRFADGGSTYDFTTANTGSDATDSDVAAILASGAGRTLNFTVAGGTTTGNVDAGYISSTTTGGDSPITVDPADYDGIVRGTKGIDTVVGAANDDYMLGLSGADTVAGRAGDDYLDGGAGVDVLIGGGGNDVFDFHIIDKAISGGDGIDTIVFRDAGVFDVSTMRISSVEVFDMANDIDDDITFSLSQIRQARNDELLIKAEAGDTITIDSDFNATLIGTFSEGGQTYNRYSLGSGDWAVRFAIDADADLVVNDTIF